MKLLYNPGNNHYDVSIVMVQKGIKVLDVTEFFVRCYDGREQELWIYNPFTYLQELLKGIP